MGRHNGFLKKRAGAALAPAADLAATLRYRAQRRTHPDAR